jgi:addiction module RelE/StbE family toxin
VKKRFPIYYLPPAERDLEDIFDYIRRDSPEQAPKFVAKIDRAVSRLSRFPQSGAIPRDPYLKRKGYRIIVVDNYLVFYRSEKGGVFIYRVLHGRRRYEFLL